MNSVAMSWRSLFINLDELEWRTMNILWHKFRHILSWLLLVGVLTLLLLVGLGLFSAPPAAKDNKTWQAIAFKRVYPNGNTSYDRYPIAKSRTSMLECL
ncbi:MAG: DUF3122 domain-containing protein [Fischerella sp.]|nr:DUF3122 domain-containing protein [Fischerella sp.]